MRPSDGRVPKNLAIIQCVGSRDKIFNEYCSGFCCMYAINAMLLKRADHGYLDLLHGYSYAFKGLRRVLFIAREMGIRLYMGGPTNQPEPETLIDCAGEDQETVR